MRRSTDDLPEYRSRVRGCLLGGALGDALGAPVEFEPIRRIRKQYGLAGLTGLVADWRGEVGLITDDTQMTLFTVEGLIRAGQTTAEETCNAILRAKVAFARMLAARDDRSIYEVDPFAECSISGQWKAPPGPLTEPTAHFVPPVSSSSTIF